MNRRNALVMCLAIVISGQAVIAMAQNAPQQPSSIPAGSKVFINPIDGFETWLVAGLHKKKVPLTIVAERDHADFEISGTMQIVEPSKWEKIAAIAARVADEPTYISTRVDVAISVRNIKTDEIVYGYAWRGTRKAQQSAAEACAKHIKAKIEGR